jgi:hypothetical protein
VIADWHKIDPAPGCGRPITPKFRFTVALRSRRLCTIGNVVQMSIANAVQLFLCSVLTIFPLNNENNMDHYSSSFKTECTLLKYSEQDVPHRK